MSYAWWKSYEMLTQTERFFHIQNPTINQTNKKKEWTKERREKKKQNKTKQKRWKTAQRIYTFQVSERFLIHMIIYMELENVWKSHQHSKIYGVIENDGNNDSDIHWVRASGWEKKWSTAHEEESKTLTIPFLNIVYLRYFTFSSFSFFLVVWRFVYISRWLAKERRYVKYKQQQPHPQ